MKTMPRASNVTDPPPLRVMFALSSMPVGGAETLLVNLVRHLDPARIIPEVVCLKQPGPLGEVLAREIPVHAGFIRHKSDLCVLSRLRDLFRQRHVDALVTVGCGDKMFWGRIAARLAGVPIVISALHSTGWPDQVGWLNRVLTPWTDAFIAVAEDHARYLVRRERFPAEKVFVVPNGVDTDRFHRDEFSRQRLRREWQIGPSQLVCTCVAALRPEKNHFRLLRVANHLRHQLPDLRFLIVGDGELREPLEATIRALQLHQHVHMLGCRSDIPAILSASDLFVLTSDNEASPVSILEAMACQLPVVASRVGSIHQVVQDGRTGFLVRSDEESTFADRLRCLALNEALRARMAAEARRRVVETNSLEVMVRGYTELIHSLYDKHQLRLDCQPALCTSR